MDLPLLPGEKARVKGAMQFYSLLLSFSLLLSALLLSSLPILSFLPLLPFLPAPLLCSSRNPLVVHPPRVCVMAAHLEVCEGLKARSRTWPSREWDSRTGAGI